MRRGKIYDWLPLWRNKWLMGSTRWELDPAERGVFIDFLCLAAADDGFIRANPTTPYPVEYLAGMLRVPADVISRTIERCVAFGKLTRLENGILYVNSWKDYQIDPRRKRELMQKGVPEPSLSSPQDSQLMGRENQTLDDTERSAASSPEIRRKLGANEEAALDKEIEKHRCEAAEYEARLLAKDGRK
ncbi:MAG: hypothetical protein ABSG73_11160 [Candidatus Aminicenantales bacterium]|jgi:hypothetical protein